MVVEAVAARDGCPECGVLSDRVHQRTRQRLRDVTVGGRELEVVLVKRQFAWVEPLCPRRTFAQVTDQVPLRARVTRRLRELVLDAVVDRGRAVSAVAAEHALAGPVQGGAPVAALRAVDDGRGYRNPAHYKARILLASAARTAG